MNRLSRAVILVIVGFGILMSMVPGSAAADAIGGVIVIPGTGTDVDPMRLRTSAGCPAQADAFYASMSGHGLPPDGQIITATTQAGFSRSIGFDVYVALVMRDYANNNHTTLAGRYDLTVYCIDRLTQKSYGEFTGSLEFTTPTTYQAIGAAKPVGSPPPPRELAPDGSAVDPDAAPSPPAALPAGEVAGDRSTGQRAQAPSPAAQSQTILDDPQLILIVVGTVLGVALIVAVAKRQLRKRRSP